MGRWTRRRVVMLDDELDNRLQEAAEKAGMQVGTYARQLILQELNRTQPVTT